jgi:hypothetical protein
MESGLIYDKEKRVQEEYLVLIKRGLKSLIEDQMNIKLDD